MAMALLPFLSSNEENASDCDCDHHMAESKVIATDLYKSFHLPQLTSLCFYKC
jgi:hypothetical protein